MSIHKTIKNISLTFFKSLKRFPVPSFLSILLAALVIITYNNGDVFSEATINNFYRLIAVTGLAIVTFLFVGMLFEKFSNKINLVKIIMLDIIVTILLCLYYFTLIQEINFVSMIRFFITLSSMFIFFFIVPYFPNRLNIELYIMKLLIRFVISVFYSLVLFTGLAIIIFTTEQLLNVPVSENLYFDCYITSLSVFGILYFISGIPKVNSTHKIEDYNVVLKILFLYIVMPLTTVYTIILYIYFIKIIVFTSWPNGIVAHLILWFGIVIIALIFLIKPIVEINKWAKFYNFWIIKTIMPLLIIMFISIGIRIKNYGVTEARYYVVTAGIIAFCIMLYWNISKIKNNVKVAFIVSIVMLLTYIGPWSAMSVSINNQNRMFKKILERNHMIKNGKVTKNYSEIADKDKIQISSIVNYFETNHDLKQLDCLPKDFKIAQFTNIFGFDYEGYYRYAQNYFDFLNNDPVSVYEIKDFDYMFKVEDYNGDEKEKIHDNFEYNYIMDKDTIQFKRNNDILYKKNIKEFLNNTIKKIGPDGKNMSGKKEKLIFNDENDKVKIKIIFNNLHFKLVEDVIEDESMDFIALIKIK